MQMQGSWGVENKVELMVSEKTTKNPNHRATIKGLDVSLVICVPCILIIGVVPE